MSCEPADEGHGPGAPFVSVVVTAVDADEELERCLASLVNVDYPPHKHEIIVADAASSDRTAAIVKQYPVRYVREAPTGVCRARNRAIHASRGELVAFTDTDCAVSTRWLKELAAAFVDENVGAVAGAIVPFPPKTNAERYAARRSSHSQLRPLSHPLRPFAMSPNLSFRRHVFDRIGLFDTRFPGGGWEDADLCWRFSRETDLKLRYAPRAVVLHHYRETAAKFLVQHYRYGFGLSLLYEKYGDELRWGFHERLRAYLDLGRSAGALVGAAIRAALERDGLDAIALHYFDFLRHVGQRAGFASGAAGRRFKS